MPTLRLLMINRELNYLDRSRTILVGVVRLRSPQVASPVENRIHTTVAGFVYAIQSRFHKSILNKTHPPH
jgi:hypothetical protein